MYVYVYMHMLHTKADLASWFSQDPLVPNWHILPPTVNFTEWGGLGCPCPRGPSIYNADISVSLSLVSALFFSLPRRPFLFPPYGDSSSSPLPMVTSLPFVLEASELP